MHTAGSGPVSLHTDKSECHGARSGVFLGAISYFAPYAGRKLSLPADYLAKGRRVGTTRTQKRIWLAPDPFPLLPR